MSRPIVDALADWADQQLHADFVDHAQRILQRYLTRAPRIDTGEWWIDCELEINAYLSVFSEEAGVRLRRIRLEPGVNGGPIVVVERRKE